MKDLLETFSDRLDLDAINAIRKPRLAALEREHWRELREILERLAMPRAGTEPRPYIEISRLEGACVDGGLFPPEDLPINLQSPCRGGAPSPPVFDSARSAVTVGKLGDLTNEQMADLERAVELLIPWRKGPFNLFGIEIDSEWRSNLKWDRVSPILGDLSGKVLADVGCGNAYYMWRALALNPKHVIGFDPSESFYFAYKLVQTFLRDERVSYELLGAEHVCLFPRFFDVILCMGVLYHHREPLTLLRSMKDGLKPGGKIIVESICIPGKEPISLTPEERYAGMKNVYFVPTVPALINWLKKTGFREVEVCSDVEMTVDEQRATKYAPFRSYPDVVSVDDPSKTVEGYPVPRRVVVYGTA